MQNSDFFAGGYIDNLVVDAGALTFLTSLPQFVDKLEYDARSVINVKIVSGFFSRTFEPHIRLGSCELLI